MLDDKGIVPYNDDYAESYLKQILTDVQTIAMVGASAKPARDSYQTMVVLLEAGNSILGQPCYAALTDIPYEIDMVDIFRTSDAALAITEEAITIGAKVVWMQLGIINLEARDKAAEVGLKVVMNRCPKLELAKPYWTNTLS